MEDNNNNNKKNYPSIPSNYVTLLQLQEKWLKEKEKQKQQQQQQQQQQLLKVEEQSIKPRLRNRKTVEKAVVAANESAEKEVNSEELSSSKKKNKKEKNMKKVKNGRNKKKEETQSRAKEEEEEVVVVVGGDAHAPPVSTEKENVSVRRVWLKKEMRPKTDNVVLVQTEGLETDRKFRDLSMKQSSSEGLDGGNVVVIDPKFRDLSMNNPSEGVKNYRINRGVRRGDLGYNGNGGGSRRVGGYQGEQRWTRSGPGLGPGVVWVKKGEIVDGNQSSSSSLKELE